ncbi:MAG: plasmid stabilization system, partial [Chitinophagia bacterium]|nr:plasmid stabilization system [Chitinophagia bacterium]
MTGYQLSYFKEVSNDIKEAKIWYSKQLPGLEKRFAKDIKIAIIRLSLNPFSHAVRYRQVRVAHPDVFPFGIHYYVDNAKQ